MSKSLEEVLDHPAYHQAVKLRGYNCLVSVFRATTDADAAKVLRRLNPAWTPAEHATLANAHAAASDRQRAVWDALLNEACLSAFGRPFQFADYRISGIGRDEFPEPVKEKLRFAAHATTYHGILARAHAYAARRR